MIEKQKLSLDEAIKILESYLSAIYYGYTTEIIDPVQAQVLHAFLQAKSIQTAYQISQLYQQLQDLTIKYEERKRYIRKNLSNEYVLEKMNEKKIDNLCLERDDELFKIKQEIIKTDLQIKSLSEVIKHYAYLSKSWQQVIEAIKKEFHLSE